MYLYTYIHSTHILISINMTHLTRRRISILQLCHTCGGDVSTETQRSDYKDFVLERKEPGPLSYKKSPDHDPYSYMYVYGYTYMYLCLCVCMYVYNVNPHQCPAVMSHAWTSHANRDTVE